jgi:uncharacterized protein (DUF302 family)
MDYGMTVRLDRPFAETAGRARAALKARGFGVLTEIDVRATLSEKLGAEMEEYLILGARNPPLAHRALDTDRRIGLLLRCNVVVRADGDATVVEALETRVMVGVSGEPGLKSVADEAARRLAAALDALAGKPAHTAASGAGQPGAGRACSPGPGEGGRERPQENDRRGCPDG